MDSFRIHMDGVDEDGSARGFRLADRIGVGFSQGKVVSDGGQQDRPEPTVGGRRSHLALDLAHCTGGRIRAVESREKAVMQDRPPTEAATINAGLLAFITS